MHKIIIAGSGIAGLMTIKTLRQRGCNLPITLLAPHAEMFYYPALIWLPSGIYQERDLVFPLEWFIRRYQVNYLAGEILTLDAHNKKLRTAAGIIEYERLVIATGGRSQKRYAGIANTFIPSEGPAAIHLMMKHLASLEKGTLAFGFTGNPAEPTGIRAEPLCQFLFGIDILLRRKQQRDKFDLIFFSSCPTPDARWGIKAGGNLMREMTRRAIHIHLGKEINEFRSGQILLDGNAIHSDLTVFIPEIIGPAWAQNSDLPLSPDGFIYIDQHGRVPGFTDSLYGAGDACCVLGNEWLAKQAHLADLQGAVVAQNLIADLDGTNLIKTFRQEFICIVDTLDAGILVFRDQQRNFVVKSKLLHWAKRLFIWQYLLRYRLKI